MMAEDLTKSPTKGAGTTLGRLIAGAETPTAATYYDDAKWANCGRIKDIQPGEITVEAVEDDYLDDEEAEWEKTTPGTKSAGETTLTIAWMPGDPVQQSIVDGIDKDEITYWRVKYANGTVDGYYGYVSSLGKTVTIKDKMTRTLKIKSVGKPVLAETNMPAQGA